MRILATLFADLVGLAFGSFLNVCLSRWPQGESIVKPRSHCRACGRTLTWWENVPLLSWLALRGRCRTCKAAISWRYPLVELAVGVLWAYKIWSFLNPGDAIDLPMDRPPGIFLIVAAWFLFLWLLMALAVLDAENLWLPNWLTLPGAALGLIFNVAQAYAAERETSIGIGAGGELIQELYAILAAAGLILLIHWLYWLVRRREGIGLGDAKLMAMLAAWLGLPGALLSFAIGIVLGALAALILLALPRRGSQSWALTKLPLGTFLCIGGIVSALWGQQIIAAFLRWEGF